MNIIFKFRNQKGLLQQELAELINDTVYDLYQIRINVKKQHVSVWENNLVESIKTPYVEPALCELIKVPVGTVNRNMAELYNLKI